jgi:nickel transport protein
MKIKLIALLTALLAFGAAGAALAHGAKIEYTVRQAVVVEVRAAFDTGEPMTAGQVTVYAPDDPTTPWLTGHCDDDGRFTFTPDPAKPGTWDIQVRQAGHGDMVHIPITGAETQPTVGTDSKTPLQLILMGASVIWGFVGTALFFLSRKKGANHAHP